MLDTIQFLTDYAGVILGFVLLLFSSVLLPANIRKYVLTAGLAILFYRAFQIYSSKQKLKEADAEREKLRQLNKELNERLKNLQEQTEGLRQEKLEIEERLNRLKKESSELDTSSAENLQHKQDLDNQVAQVLKESEVVSKRHEEQVVMLNQIAEQSRQISSNWFENR